MITAEGTITFDGRRHRRHGSPTQIVRAGIAPCAAGPGHVRRPDRRGQPARSARTSRNDDRVDADLDALVRAVSRGSANGGRRRPAASRGGEQQMLAIARALMSRPRLLLLRRAVASASRRSSPRSCSRPLRELNQEEGMRSCSSSRTPTSRSTSPTAATCSRPARSSPAATPSDARATTPSARPTWGTESWTCSSPSSLNGIGNGVVYALRRARRSCIIFRDDGPPELRPGRDGSVRDLHLLELTDQSACPSGSRSSCRWPSSFVGWRDHRAALDPAGRTGTQSAQRRDRHARHVPRDQLARAAHVRNRSTNDAEAVADRRFPAMTRRFRSSARRSPGPSSLSPSCWLRSVCCSTCCCSAPGSG